MACTLGTIQGCCGVVLVVADSVSASASFLHDVNAIERANNEQRVNFDFIGSIF